MIYTRKLYIVVQYEAYEFKGIKLLEENNFKVLTIFDSEKEANNYLKELLLFIHNEIQNGNRTTDNLDPSKKLSFKIIETEISFNT